MAIKISRTLIQQIESWRKNFNLLPVRWIADKNLHVTLIPPWWEQDVKIEISKIQNIKARPFKIVFTKVEFGPERKRPRLIWATGQAPQELVELKTKLEKIYPQPKNKRQWQMHLTVARFNPLNFSDFPTRQLNQKVLWQGTVNSFVLMESHLFRQGADYTMIKEYRF